MAYLFSGILSAVILIPLSLWLVRSSPEDMGLLPDNGEMGEDSHHKSSGGPEPGLRLNEAIRTPAFWLMTVAFTIYGFASGALFQNQAPHLQDIGFSAAIAASAVGGVGIGSAIGKFGFGWLSDFIPAKYTLVIGSTFQAAGTLILMRVTSSSPLVVIWLYSVTLGLGGGSWFPGISMTTSISFGLTAYGVIFGIYTMLFFIAQAFGPLAAGRVFDISGSYTLAFVLVIVVVVAGGMTAMTLKEPGSCEQPEKIEAGKI